VDGSATRPFVIPGQPRDLQFYGPFVGMFFDRAEWSGPAVRLTGIQPARKPLLFIGSIAEGSAVRSASDNSISKCAPLPLVIPTEAKRRDLRLLFALPPRHPFQLASDDKPTATRPAVRFGDYNSGMHCWQRRAPGVSA